jgi:hypothetical protein
VASNEEPIGNRRPLVIVEDHLHHVGELLSALATEAPDLLDQTTVVCLERAGPDTARSVHDWLERYPLLQVRAAVDEADVAGAARPRLRSLAEAVFREPRSLALEIAASLRPDGLLVQDIQLASLTFVPADRWWESIFVAAAVRGLYPVAPPTCRFLSNKRGYAATFGRELMEQGFDPRDVMDKGETRQVVVPVVRRHVDQRFELELRRSERSTIGPVRIGAGSSERSDLEASLDLLLWPRGEAGYELGGRALGRGKPRVALRAGSQEAMTWRQLIDDRLASGDGIAVIEVGERVAPEGAGRAEATNAAARHLHTLRGRLSVDDAILTAAHAYRLSDSLRVGRADPPATFAEERPSRKVAE